MKITVFGSYMTDLMARGEHLPAPGETVKSSFFTLGPGGKGFNQGVAATKSGGDVMMIAKIGEDSFGEIAMANMKKLGVNTDRILKTADVSTGTALVMVDANTSQNQIMVTLGSNGTFDKEDMVVVKDAIDQSDVILLQMEINFDALEEAITYAHSKGVKVVLNPAPAAVLSDDVLSSVDIITPNEVEAGMLTGVTIKTPQDAEKAAKVFFNKGIKGVVITLGKLGVFVATEEKSQMVDNYDVKVMDTTGAGDAFNGGFVTALSQGKDIFDAAEFGNVVSNLAVTKVGTALAMPSKDEIEEFISNHTK